MLISPKATLTFRSILIAGFLFANSPTPAQIINQPSTRVSSVTEYLFLESIDSALLIMRVEYLLREKKGKNNEREEYGKGELSYFGRVQGVAVVSDSQFWFDARLLEPWKYGDAVIYNEYKDENLYEPFVKKIYLRRLTDKKFVEYPFLEDSILNLQTKLGCLPLKGDFVQMPQLRSVRPDGDTSGLIVLVTVSNPEQLEAEHLEAAAATIQPGAIQYNAQGGGEYKRSILNARARPAVGGLYCRLEPSTGVIELGFAGIFSAGPNTSSLEFVPVLISSQIRQQSIKQPLKPISDKKNKSGKGND